MTYLGLTDLFYRWVYTRQGIGYLAKSKAFPAPAIIANEGKTKLWTADAITAFEKDHPEVLDAERKRKKVAAYARCIMKKRGG